MSHEHSQDPTNHDHSIVDSDHHDGTTQEHQETSSVLSGDSATVGSQSSSHSHSHSGDTDFATDFWALMGSPSHWLFEIVTSFVLYLIFGIIIYQFIIVKHVIPRYNKTMNRKLNDLHEELDTEHGVEHSEEK